MTHEYIPWMPELSVGVKLFDQQHQHLIHLINELHEVDREGGSKMASEHALRNLVAYVKTHFAAEERVLKEHAYPDFDRHKQEHDKMSARVFGFQREVQEGRSVSSLNLASVLTEWLKSHIMETDQQYKSFLMERGVK